MIGREGNGLVLRVEVSERCEPFTVMLGRLGQGTSWRGGSFTKTAYAVPFLQAHLAVVRMLDLCREAGILKAARDEGEFWESRNLEVLARCMNSSAEALKEHVPGFKELARKLGMEAVAADDQAEDCKRVDNE